MQSSLLELPRIYIKESSFWEALFFVPICDSGNLSGQNNEGGHSDVATFFCVLD